MTPLLNGSPLFSESNTSKPEIRNPKSERASIPWAILAALGLLLSFVATQASIVFEATTPYHHIRVVDEGGIRTLSFDGSYETQMNLRDPMTGHFEYTEYFHMPLLMNPELRRVLMVGLGGGSTQRSYQHYYPDIMVETVELDPTVVDVAKRFFHLEDSKTLQVQTADGRVFLRRSQDKYDSIIMDAYVSGRYGSSLPYHLATKEFFQIVSDHLTTNGIIAYNIIGTVDGWQADILGAVYKTLKEIFPKVYLFPATTSSNVVLIGTKNPEAFTIAKLQQRADEFAKEKRQTMPRLRTRLRAMKSEAPAGAAQARVLTDDFAPVDNLLRSGK